MAQTRTSQRRPMTREEAQARQRAREERERKAAESRELAKGPLDTPFLMLVLLLTAIGLIMLLSASFPSAYFDGEKPTYYFTRQLVFAIMGFAVMLFVGKLNYQRFRHYGKPLMVIAILLLVFILIPHNPLAITRKGSTRWLGVGSFQFQPSEVAKLAVVVYFADSVSKKKDQMRTFSQGVLPYGLILMLMAVLVGAEPHMSGAVLVLGGGAAIILAGGIKWRYVFLAAAAAIGAMAAYMLLKGYNLSRLTSWQDPWADYYDTGFQLAQSLITIGSGGLLGVGLGKSRQKYSYLPEESNDFIFSVTCEELGLIGAIVIILLYMALILRGYWIALHARDRFGALMVVGIITLLAAQTFLNIGVVTGFLPTTGISLPFFSYGGTALLIQLTEMGVVLSVSRQMKPTKAG